MSARSETLEQMERRWPGICNAFLMASLGQHDTARRLAVVKGNARDVILADDLSLDGIGQAAADYDLARNAGARLVVPGDEEWPGWMNDQLGALGYGVVGLWVRGDGKLSEALRRSVSIVGSRAASDYGRHIAGEWSRDLAERGFNVVSGGAFGIDAAALWGAKSVDGRRCVVVLPSGVLNPSPAGNEGLFEAILGSGGLLVSEYAPFSGPSVGRLLERNVVAAAASRATVVVEAGIRSGSTNTARVMRLMGKTVYAVPGPITSAASAGCHELIKSGAARLVDSPADVYATLP